MLLSILCYDLCYLWISRALSGDGNDESLKTAISLYHVLEEKGREPQYDGYVELFIEKLGKLEQYDNNAPKTMNASSACVGSL